MHRINERNIGSITLDAAPKKRSKNFTAYELDTLNHILTQVYDAMEQDEITQSYTDCGRITLSLTGEQMFDLFQLIQKIN